MKTMDPVQHTAIRTSWGWIGVAAAEESVRRVLLPRPTKGDVLASFAAPVLGRAQLSPFLRSVCERIECYVNGESVDFDEPLDLADVSAFHRLALEECRRIPYGSTCSYRELAARCGRPGAARAVGAAMARNPVPIIVPCHRVLRSDGTLGGFGGGLALKRRMLQSEALQRPAP